MNWQQNAGTPNNP